MAKKKRTTAKPRQKGAATGKVAQPLTAESSGSWFHTMSRRSVLRSAAVVGTALAGGAAIHFYDSRNRELHDLTVIGAGHPVVLQVHDPSCPTCRSLKAKTESALEQLPEIVYRIADLTQPAGKEIAEKYGVGKVTLLLFDHTGKHIATIQGDTPAATLEKTFREQFRLS
ncbi:MAG: thioredoxin family protein [Gammaproteobacteria bacterium]|nr:thioredoxin family protein [Gammaproteobacteria bacterium]